MNHSGMSMTATATAAAASSTSAAMSMDDSMGGGCKISMLWNWYTIDACFLSTSWRVRSRGAFAASCIGIALLVICLELLRRLGKEYDAFLLRRFQQHIASQPVAETQRLHGPQFVTFRATPLQQLIRSIIHAATFGVAYIVMLLAMYYNGYIIISIIIGAGVGKYVTDWMVHRLPFNTTTTDKPQADGIEDPTVCCG